MFFDFNCSALDLCDEPVTIEVLNSRKIRSDSLIGAFKFDLGLVYESTGTADLYTAIMTAHLFISNIPFLLFSSSILIWTDLSILFNYFVQYPMQYCTITVFLHTIIIFIKLLV